MALDTEPEAELEDDLPQDPVDDIDDDLELEEPSAESTTPEEPVQQPSGDVTPQWTAAFAQARAEFGLNDIPDDPRAVAQQLHQYRQTFQQQAQQTAWLQNLYFQQQQQAQQPVAPVQPKQPEWSVPEFDPSWLNMVADDGNGNLVAKPGVMPDIPQKILAYQSWKTKTADRLLTDPVKFMDEVYGPKLEERARQIAADSVKQYAINTQAQQIAAQVRPWAFVHDAQGNMLSSPTGQPQLTPAGAQYTQYLRELHNQGITDPGKQHEYAQQMVFGHMYQFSQQQVQPQVQQAQQQMNILRNGAAAARPQQPVPAGKPKPQSIKGKAGFSRALRERLAAVPRSDFKDFS